MRALLIILIITNSILGFAAAPLREDLKNVCVMVKAETSPNRHRPVGTATGTGFLVRNDLVLTCNHLTFIPTPHGVIPASSIYIEREKGQYVPARIIQRDEDHDLALLQLKTAAECKPYEVCRFAMKSGDEVTIVGNFPEAIRVTRGKLMRRSIMQGFAISSAKVRSGFSGGPVLDKDGKVQGILSQRDDYNNSIFVRSDVILKLLAKAGMEPGSNDAPTSLTETTSIASKADESGLRKSSETERVDDTRHDESGENELVIAIPVRRNSAVYSTGK